MKFFYTRGGKALAFVACILCAAIFAAAGIGAIYMIDKGYYDRTERAVYDAAIYGQLLNSGNEIIWDANSSGYCPVLLGDRGNLSFMIQDGRNRYIAISRGAKEAGWGYDPDQYRYKMFYRIMKNANGSIDVVDVNRFTPDDYEQASFLNNYENYTVCFNLHSPFTVEDSFSRTAGWVHIAYALRWWVYGIAAVALLLAIVFFVILMKAAGRRPNTDEVFPGPLDKVPFDLLLIPLLLGAALCTLPAYEWYEIALLLAGIAALACVALGLCMSFAGRVKRGALVKNTVIYRVFSGLWKLIGKLPLVWRTCLIFLGLSALELFAIVLCRRSVEALLLFWFLEKLLLFPLIIYIALGLRRLQAGGKALAAGDLRYQTDTRRLVWALKSHGENLNSIALGMNNAVEERLRSERMKTELITNVSHDLKTPLTSILNYSGLIAAEPCENEKITEYARVLTRQSERLTRLIDDLVEASKASTGNLEVHLAPCDAGVLVTQAAGEYEEKLRACGLTLIAKRPEEPLRILADGRRMQRIFDNLLNNICKYALPGTRVYLTAQRMVDSAVITFKNTSAQPLDISEEELMERFVRGDSARSTEGNGLGLSIARSLAELQNGQLRLHIDGDLFKAILVFPICA